MIYHFEWKVGTILDFVIHASCITPSCMISWHPYRVTQAALPLTIEGQKDVQYLFITLLPLNMKWALTHINMGITQRKNRFCVAPVALCSIVCKSFSFDRGIWLVTVNENVAWDLCGFIGLRFGSWKRRSVIFLHIRMRVGTQGHYYSMPTEIYFLKPREGF